MVFIMTQIDRKSKTPIYKQIYEDINLRIQQGEYALGKMLPSESKLCSIYGVERDTVRRALALMVDDGKIAKMPGLGASVIIPEEKNDSKKKSILFILPKGRHNTDRISEPFNAKLMDTMEYECIERGYDLLYKSFTKNDTAEDLIHACNPSGVFFTSYLPIETYKELHMKGIPVVLVNQNHLLYPSVCLDNKGGAKMVMEYLLALGHKDIGFISGSADDQIQSSRFSGYRESLENNGLPLNTDWVLQGDWSMESGKAAMQKLLKKGNLPTALFAANDAMAIGAIMEALNWGVSIPESISVVGFDNIDQSSFINPSLTTVAVDYHAMSRAACMLMFDMLDHNSCELNVNIYVPLNLVDRESTKRVEIK
jgi:LacI family transcriptional regulator